MKLFKSLLVAPATLGLLAPMSATANEVTISDFSPEEQLAVTNSRVDGLEARLNNIEAGSFSETTTASFSADMMVGAVDAGTSADAIMAGYSFQIDLNTSFTGEDSLDVSLDAGTGGVAGIAEFDGNSGGDGLSVDGVSYTFPIGAKTTAFVGDSTDGSLLFNTACVYSGPSNTLDDCGNNYSAINAGGGTAFGASYDVGNGVALAFGYTGEGNRDGLMSSGGDDAFATQIAYTADNYGLSLTYADKENPTFNQAVTEATVWGFNGYYTPSSEGIPSISVGFEIGDAEIPALTPTDTDTSSWFVGLQWDEVGPGTAGLAVGTKQHTVDNSTLDDELLMYEAFYSYNVNDGMTITPLIYIKEFAPGTTDETGLMVKTSFSF